MMNGRRNEDAIYYAHGMKLPLAQRVAIFARRRMFKHFLSVMRPAREARILDFGVSEDIAEESNVLERLYEYPENITCLGIGDGTQLRRVFPDVNYVSIIPNQRLPFDDCQFDIATSNAVFEHLGSDANRHEALHEMLRVAKRVYITVPNALFPIEHHSGVPLLHFMPSIFRATLRSSRLDYWTHPENLDFITKRRLIALAAGIRGFNVEYCGLQMGPFSSNIAMWTS